MIILYFVFSCPSYVQSYHDSLYIHGFVVWVAAISVLVTESIHLHMLFFLIYEGRAMDILWRMLCSTGKYNHRYHCKVEH